MHPVEFPAIACATHKDNEKTLPVHIEPLGFDLDAFLKADFDIFAQPSWLDSVAQGAPDLQSSNQATTLSSTCHNDQGILSDGWGQSSNSNNSGVMGAGEGSLMNSLFASK